MAIWASWPLEHGPNNCLPGDKRMQSCGNRSHSIVSSWFDRICSNRQANLRFWQTYQFVVSYKDKIDRMLIIVYRDLGELRIFVTKYSESSLNRMWKYAIHLICTLCVRNWLIFNQVVPWMQLCSDPHNGDILAPSSLLNVRRWWNQSQIALTYGQTMI